MFKEFRKKLKKRKEEQQRRRELAKYWANYYKGTGYENFYKEMYK